MSIDLKNKASVINIDTNKFKTDFAAIEYFTKSDPVLNAYNSLLASVMARACKEYPSMKEISNVLDSLYGTSFISCATNVGPMNFLSFRSMFLCDKYVPDGEIGNEVLRVIDSIINNPYITDNCFSEDFVETERTNILANIEAEKNNKNRYCVLRCREEMFKDEIFGIPEYGTKEAIMSITPASLYEHYNKVMSEYGRLFGYVGGGAEKLSSGINNIYSNYEDQKTSFATADLKVKADCVRNVVDDEPVKQAKLCLGFRTGTSLYEEDYGKFILFNEVFSGSPVSKLFKNVREKMSLCYYCSSIPGAFSGSAIVTAGIDAKNKDVAQNEILNQLKAIQDGDVSDAEFEQAKISLVNSYKELEDSSYRMYQWYKNRYIVGRSDSPADAAKQCMEITKDDIVEAANRMSLDTVYYMNPTLQGDDEEDEDYE